MLQLLPFDIVLTIAQMSPVIWYRIVQVDSRLVEYIQDELHKEWIRDLFTYVIVKKRSTIFYLPNGQLHRDGDKPAVIQYFILDTTKPWYFEWYKHGLKHRDGGLPAKINHDGTYGSWWVNGKLHRDDGLPARICTDQDEWWVNGKRHRDDGGPALVSKYRTEWWVDDKLHRDGDLPALVHVPRHNNGVLHEWWINGKRHRDNGEPAIIRPNGTSEWWINGHKKGCTCHLKGLCLLLRNNIIINNTVNL
jgi:hypothetical protein